MPAKNIKNVKSAYPEIKDIQEDLQSLQTDATRLGRRVAADGREKIQEIADGAQDQIATLKDQGAKQIQHLEKRIKAKPVQSVAVAFGAGLLLSLLLGRR